MSRAKKPLDPFASALGEGFSPSVIDAFTPLGYTPSPKQRTFHDLSRMRIDTILFGGARGGGKELSLFTEIPTPSGWTYAKDLHPGDHLFGRDGKVYPILAESTIKTHDGYELTFDDGSTVICNDEHLWLTFDSSERSAIQRRSPEYRERRRSSRASRAKDNPSKGAVQSASVSRLNSERKYTYKDPPIGTVRTTAEIVATLSTGYGERSGRVENNHAVPVCSPVEMPERDLPLDPYLFGVWLGDGSKGNGSVTSMDEDIPAAFVAAGFPIKNIQQKPNNQASTYRFGGLIDHIRRIGVYKNKHITHEYLWASADQRLALLQGLMDTDGNCNNDGSAEFCNTNQDLTQGVAFLARSLGHKVTVREGRASLYGKDCGPKWTVKFTPQMDIFRLKRKSERQKFPSGQKTRFRFIISAERVHDVEMKCFKVDSPDHLFLVTENFIPTHNSAALTMEAIHCAVNFPGMRVLCLRRTYPELEESFLAELKKRKYALALGAKWNQTDKKLRFLNGSEINFSYAESELDISRILGGEYQLICIDEASRTLPVVLKHSEENLRSANPSIPVIGSRWATNPGGTAGSYLKQRIIQPTGKGAHLAEDSTGRKVAYIQSLYTDNPHLDQKAYEQILNAIDDPARRAAMRDGDWDAQVGQFFEQWRYDRHVIDSSEKFLPLPEHWQRYAGIDWGTHAPYACVWAACDENGRMWVYKELYAAGVDTRSQAQAILALEERDNEREVIRSADPSMWANRGTPMTNADVYGLEGCGLIKADNDRPNGWARCHHYLNDGVACEYHAAPPFNWETCPMLHVFGDQCPSFVEWIPALERDKHNPDDADTKGEDHMPDAWRYLCMTASVAGGPVLYENDKNISQEDIRRLLEEERAAYLPAQVDVRGPFAYANLGIKP